MVEPIKVVTVERRLGGGIFGGGGVSLSLFLLFMLPLSSDEDSFGLVDLESKEDDDKHVVAVPKMKVVLDG